MLHAHNETSFRIYMDDWRYSMSLTTAKAGSFTKAQRGGAQAADFGLVLD